MFYVCHVKAGQKSLLNQALINTFLNKNLGVLPKERLQSIIGKNCAKVFVKLFSEELWIIPTIF